MCRTFASFLTWKGYSAILVVGIACPLGRMKCLRDGSPGSCHGSLLVPTLDVAALSAMVVGINPVAMPSFSSSSSTPMVYSLCC